MESDPDEKQVPLVVEDPEAQKRHAELSSEEGVSLRRWQVSFASGRGWYPVGEFVAADAPSAIDRAIEIFGSASGYRAEEIPWDAAPLPRPKVREKKN